jgi:hypothetical protein
VRSRKQKCEITNRLVFASRLCVPNAQQCVAIAGAYPNPPFALDIVHSNLHPRILIESMRNANERTNNGTVD